MRDIRRCTRQRMFYCTQAPSAPTLYLLSIVVFLHDLAVCTEIEPLAGILSPGILRHRPVGLKIVPVSSNIFHPVTIFPSGSSRNQRHRSYRSFRQPLFHQRIHISSFRCPEPTFRSLLLRSRCRAVSGRIAFLCIDILISVVQHFLCICIVGALWI